MEWTYLPFVIETSSIEEVSSKTSPEEIVTDLAMQKARDVFSKTSSENPFVIGADTIVVLDQFILGKPKDRDDAKRILKSLSGRSHQVLTGVAFKWNERELFFYEKTTVNFAKISDELLEMYLKTGESFDKAGAYGIQGAAISFIESINGSYSNVVGLPVDRVLKEMENCLKDKGEWRKCFI